MDIAVIIAVLLILCLLIVRNHLLKLCRRQPGKKNVFPNRTCCPGHPHTWYLQIDDMGFPKCTKDKERSWSTLHSAEPAVQL